MIIDSQNSGLNSNVPSNGGNFTIAATAQAFQILSSGVYEHKIAAVVREYMTNALDSHTQAGKEDVPFQVTIPNELHPYFEVEDFGIGMDMDAAVNIYTRYFTSTKSSSNEVAGGFGLGGKSFLAYTKQFTVRFRKNGLEHTALIYIDANSCPRLDVIVSVPTDKGDGVKISIPVQKQDFYQFTQEILFYSSFYKVRPIFNQDVEPNYNNELFHRDDQDVFVSGVRPGSALGNYPVYVLMGPVPYPVNTDTLIGLDGEEKHFFSNGSTRPERSKVFVKMPIGSIAIAASRESLSLDQNSERVLTERLKQVVVQAKKEAEEFVNRIDLHPIEILENICVKFPNPIVRKYATHDIRPMIDKYHGGYVRIPKLRTVAHVGYGANRRFNFKPIQGSYANLVLGSNFAKNKIEKLTVIEYDKPLRRINQIFSENQNIQYVHNGPLSERRKNRIEKILGVPVETVKYSALYKEYVNSKKEERVEPKEDRGEPTVRVKREKNELSVSGFTISRDFSKKFVNQLTDLSQDNIYWFTENDAEQVEYAVRRVLHFLDSDSKITVVRRNSKTEKKLNYNNIGSIVKFMKKFEEDHFEEFKWWGLNTNFIGNDTYIPFMLADSKLLKKEVKELHRQIWDIRQKSKKLPFSIGWCRLLPNTSNWQAEILGELNQRWSKVPSSEQYDISIEMRDNYPLIYSINSAQTKHVLRDELSLKTMIEYIRQVDSTNQETRK